MKDAAPEATRLADYTPYPFTLSDVRLTFRLEPHATRVTAHIVFTPNTARPGRHDLFLFGEKLRLVAATIDGRDASSLAQIDDAGLTIPAAHLPEGAFIWQAEVEIDPANNT